MASSALVTYGVPCDYAEFYEQYAREIKNLVWLNLRGYGQQADVQDGVNYIFQQFIKNDMLAKFDSSRISSKTGEPVTFCGYAMSLASLYCRGLRSSLERRRRHESLWLDGQYEDGSASTLLDERAATVDEYPSFEGMGVEGLRVALEARGRQPGHWPVLPLFDALAARAAEGKRVSLSAVSRQFQLTKKNTEAWFTDLCEALREVTTHSGYAEPVASPVVPGDIPLTECAVPEPEVPDTWFEQARAAASSEPACELGGLALTREELAAAAAALRETPDTRVLPAWKKAGHRLAGQGKTWYLGFAAQVIEQYPEFDKPKGGHYPGGHGGRVKPALIFGLEMLAGTLPVDDPVPEGAGPPVDVLWDEFGAALCPA